MNTWDGLTLTLTRQQQRMLRRVMRQAAQTLLTPEVRGALLRLALDVLHDLPPTTFLCDACGRSVATDRKRLHLNEDGHLKCLEHGKLEEITIEGWRNEWTRRGKPERLNWRLEPLG